MEFLFSFFFFFNRHPSGATSLWALAMLEHRALKYIANQPSRATTIGSPTDKSPRCQVAIFFISTFPHLLPCRARVSPVVPDASSRRDAHFSRRVEKLFFHPQLNTTGENHFSSRFFSATPPIVCAGKNPRFCSECVTIFLRSCHVNEKYLFFLSISPSHLLRRLPFCSKA